MNKTQNKSVAEVIIEQIYILAEWNKQNISSLEQGETNNTIAQKTKAIIDLTYALVTLTKKCQIEGCPIFISKDSDGGKGYGLS